MKSQYLKENTFNGKNMFTLEDLNQKHQKDYESKLALE
jgi:hypothetical protein